MSDVGLKFNVRKLFFDTFLVTDALDKATLQYLRRAGGATRLTARRSMRRRKASSKPGQPPSAHRGDLKERLWFALSPDMKSVVVGPVLFNQVDQLNGSFRSGTIPELHEFGGVLGIVEQQFFPGGNWHRVDKRRRANDNLKRIRKAVYPARPYMAPALAVVQPSLAGMWANSVR